MRGGAVIGEVKRNKGRKSRKTEGKLGDEK